ncbi:MAG: class I SAM-dependent methyltransferase [bacterium]
MKDRETENKKVLKMVEEFYDAAATSFSDTRKYWWDDLQFISRYVKSYNTVLDFGCGNGRFLHFCAIPPKKYLGVDISANLIELAQTMHPTHRFIKIDDGKMSEIKEKFDAVVSIAVFHHMTPAMARNALQELYCVIKPGGVIIITAWYLWNTEKISFLMKSWRRGNWGLMAPVPFHGKKKTYQRLCYWWRKKTLEKIVTTEHFSIVESGITRGEKGKKRNIYIIAQKK